MNGTCKGPQEEKMVNPAVNSVPDVYDGVCEGEYQRPNDLPILSDSFNVGEDKVIVTTEFLNKLKDFEYWKEWRNKR